MKWYIFFIVPFLTAFSPRYETYDFNKVSDEFRNVEEDVQSQEFQVYTTTPNLTDLKNGQIVIFSSGAIKLMWRENNDIYTIQGSCITIRR